MKKKIISAILSVVTVITLTGCGDAADYVSAHIFERGEESEDETASQEENTEEDFFGNSSISGSEPEPEGEPDKAGMNSITVMASEDWIEEAEMDLGQRFEDETGIHVDYEIVPADQYQDLLLTRLNTGSVADIWCAQSGFALDTIYNVRENAVDLSGEPWADAYSRFSAEQTGVDGVNYGLTYYDTTTDYYMVYNKRLFEKAGIEEPPKTYKELTEACNALLSIGVTPIYEPVADGWHQTMLWTASTQILEKVEPWLIDKLNTNKTTFAENAHFKKMLEQISSLAEKGYFGDNYMFDKFVDAEGCLASGEYAACLLKPGSIKAIISSDRNQNGYKEEDFGFFILPILDNQMLNVHPAGPSHFIFSGSGNIEAAKKYLEFIVRKDSLQYVIDNASDVENFPIDQGQKPEYSKTTTEFLEQFGDADSGMVLQDEVKYFNEQWMDISANLASEFAGEMTSEDVLRAIDDERTRLAEAAGDENWQ